MIGKKGSTTKSRSSIFGVKMDIFP